MSVPSALISPSASVVLIGLVVVAAGFIGFVIIWWIRNVLRHRLPKPFLGDGSNVEWAEQKRAEIATGGITNDPELKDDAVRFDLEVIDSDLELQSRGISIGGSGSHSEKNPLESTDGINADELLYSWLSDSGHPDDDWAEKLLGDREPTLGS